jgi:DNA-binding LacI/PurR family transcriptional regulator
MGTRIADYLLGRINGRDGPNKIELEAEVIIRGSTGPVRAASALRPRRAV